MVGGIGWRGGIKIASDSTPSVMSQPKASFYTVQLKINYKSTNLRKNGSGISDVAFASVYSEKTRLKKLMKIIND